MIWLLIVAIGSATFAIRLSFIMLWGRFEVPSLIHRALRFVPTAVLSAIIVPAMVILDGSLNASPGNPRLLAGVLAAAVAWRTKNVVITIAVGMAALWLFQAMLS